MKRYVEPTEKARQLFFLALLMISGLALLADRLDELLPISSDTSVALDQVLERSLLGAVLSSVFYGALAGIAIHLTRRAVVSKQWPPVGMSVPFRTAVREVRRPWTAWTCLGLVLLAFALQIAGPWYGYVTVRELIPKLKQVLERQPNLSLQDRRPAGAAELQR